MAAQCSLSSRYSWGTELRRTIMGLLCAALLCVSGAYEKGTNDDIEEFIYQLLDVFGDGLVGRSDLQAVLTAVLTNISSNKSYRSEPGSEREILDIFLSAANLTTDDKKCVESYLSFEEFRKCCALLPSV